MKPNWANQTIWTADNLDVLRGMNSECVDLIYLDPPFNSNRNYAAPIGSKAAGAAFKDTWTLSDVDLAWIGIIAEQEPNLSAVIDAAGLAHGKGMKSYLVMMAVRLLEMRRVLKPTGSIYVHCDPTANAYLRILMDAVFGAANFLNEITWHRTRGKGLNPRRYVWNCDRLLYYSRSRRRTWNQQYEAFEPGYGDGWREDEHGKWEAENLTGGKAGGPSAYEPFNGVLPAAGRAWAPPVREKFPLDLQRRLPDDYEILTQLDKCKALDEAGLIYWPKKKGGKPRYKKYLSTLAGRYVSDLIADTPPVSSQSRERTGYPTQKPLALLERIIKASSNEGDMVLDPFCGCATTCIAAEKQGRQWVGIDLSAKAAELVRVRMVRETNLFDWFNPIVRTDIPKRTDVGKLPPYQTHRHTLYGKQEGNWAGCGHHFPFRNLTVDHITARAKGGTDHPDNLQLLCGACNSMKGTMDQATFVAKLRREGIGR
ncbi:MAG: DNA methyltransferase [Bryobacterales bacterium]|nr:DNA methyltransferase [Bryobacterales bacterium]